MASKGKRTRSVKQPKRQPRKRKAIKRRPRKSVSRNKITSSSKRKTRTVTRTQTRTKISSPGAKPFYITREKIEYKRSRTLTKKKRKYHVSGFDKEFTKFYLKHRRKGKSFIGRMKLSINVRGKRVTQWVSTPRRFFVDKNDALAYIKRGLDDDLKNLLRKYDIQTLASNILLKAIQFEVKRGEAINEVPASSNQNTAKNRKKWGRQRKPPA